MDDMARRHGPPDAGSAPCLQHMAAIVAPQPAPGLEDLRQQLTQVCRPTADVSLPKPPASSSPARFDSPGPALAGCVRAYLSRDMRDRASPGLNRFPASPYAGISWYLQGQVALVKGGASAEPLPATIFAGPQSRPFGIQDRGPVRSFSVIFYPQALHLLTGLDLAALGDTVQAAEAVLPRDWWPLLDAVRDAPDTEARIATLEAFVAARWHAVAPAAAPGWRAPAWVDGLRWSVAQAAGLGSSLRTVERRIRRWAGLPMRRLRRLARAETALSQARMQADQGQPPPWCDVAAQGGYADQAHLCRETREITGHSPAELARRVGDDESYWLYRIWS
jgi:AraC-like DNA-binding protein